MGWGGVLNFFVKANITIGCHGGRVFIGDLIGHEGGGAGLGASGGVRLHGCRRW